MEEHPYVPRDLKLPGYVPVSLSQSTILSVYAVASLLVVLLVWFLSGYFAFSPEFYKENTGFYLAEVWKEYSKGDSRYAGRDTSIVTVEGITSVLEGPPSLLAVCYSQRKGYSYTLQFAISLGQLYGTFVYFITAYLDGDNFAASPFYYYAYYILANSFWILIPSLIAIRCWKKISLAVQSQSQSQKKNKVR